MQGRISNGKNEIAIRMIGSLILLILLLLLLLQHKCPLLLEVILVVWMIIGLIVIANKLQSI